MRFNWVNGWRKTETSARCYIQFLSSLHEGPNMVLVARAVHDGLRQPIQNHAQASSGVAARRPPKETRCQPVLHGLGKLGLNSPTCGRLDCFATCKTCLCLFYPHFFKTAAVLIFWCFGSSLTQSRFAYDIIHIFWWVEERAATRRTKQMLYFLFHSILVLVITTVCLAGAATVQNLNLVADMSFISV